MKILIVKPSSLGDIIHTLPAVELLRQQFPHAHISWLVNDSFADVLKPVTIIDEILLFHRKRWLRPQYWPEVIRFLKMIRANCFDMVLDFQGLLRSGIIAGCSGAERRIGFADAREGATFFYTDKINLPATVAHALEKNVYLVKQSLDCDYKVRFPQFLSSAETAGQTEDLFRACAFNQQAPLLAVAPAARWQTKTWPPAFFAAVLNTVMDSCPKCQVYILGTDADAAIAAEVCGACRTCRPRDLTGKTPLDTLVHMLQKTDVLLTNDSGPMHLAAALNVNVVALFGPTDPVRTGPYGNDHVVFQADCDAAPCFQKTCPRAEQTCAISLDPVCVARAVLEKLKIKNPEARDK